MATIKSHTDLQQSKKLAKILPLESADMYYEWPNKKVHFKDDKYNGMGFSCWSLAALLGVLPKIDSEEPMIQKLYYANTPTERYICQYSLTNITGEYDNPVDACVSMIEKLHELKML